MFWEGPDPGVQSVAFYVREPGKGAFRSADHFGA